MFYSEVMANLEKIKGETKFLERQIQEKTFGYILTALGLVVGLAWNDAIKSLIDFLFPLDRNSLTAQFVYAILLTLVVVIVTTYVTRYLHRDEK